MIYSPHMTGRKLRELRGGLSLREAAKKLDCDFTYLSKIETGSMNPSWNFLKKAFTVYKVKEEEKGLFAYNYLRNSHYDVLNIALEYLKV